MAFLGGSTTVSGIHRVKSKTKCMNGPGSKNGIHVRERRWRVGVAEYIWMVLKTSRPSHRAMLCRREEDRFRSRNTREMNRIKCGGQNQMEKGGWIRHSEPDIHTRNPTLIVYDQFSICYTDQFMDLENESQFFFFFFNWPWLCNEQHCVLSLWWSWNTTDWSN